MLIARRTHYRTQSYYAGDSLLGYALIAVALLVWCVWMPLAIIGS